MVTRRTAVREHPIKLEPYEIAHTNSKRVFLWPSCATAMNPIFQCSSSPNLQHPHARRPFLRLLQMICPSTARRDCSSMLRPRPARRWNPVSAGARNASHPHFPICILNFETSCIKRICGQFVFYGFYCAALELARPIDPASKCEREGTRIRTGVPSRPMQCKLAKEKLPEGGHPTGSRPASLCTGGRSPPLSHSVLCTLKEPRNRLALVKECLID